MPKKTRNASGLGDGRPDGNRWMMLFLLTAIYVCNNIDRHAIAVLAEPIRRDLALSDTQLGMLTGLVFAVFYACFGIPAGWLADRFGRVRIIAIACVLWSVCSVMSGLARSFAQLALTRIGVGIGEAGGTAPSYSLIASQFPSHERGRALGLYSLGSPIATLIAIAGAGWAAAYVGWRTSLIVVSLPGLLLALVFWLAVKEPVERGDAESAPPFLATIKVFLASRILAVAAVASGCSAMITYSFSAWLPAYLIRIKGMSLTELAAWFSITNAAAFGFGLWLGGWLCDRFIGRTKRAYALIPCIGLLAGAPTFLFALSLPGWKASVVAMVFPVIASGIFLAPMLALVQDHSPVGSRSQFSALFLLINNLLGAGLGPLYVGFLSDLARPTLGDNALTFGMTMLAPLFLLASGAHWLLSKRLQHETAPQAASLVQV